MYYVYVLKSKVAKKSYVGFTSNLKRRLKEHNTGKNFYTKRHKPWGIAHTECYKTKKEAIKVEKYFKSAAGRRKLKQIFAKIN